jgi:glycosyltransferase involved in cell wall biosynthesis
MVGSASILILNGGKGDAQRYRCTHLQAQLSSVGVPCAVRHFQEVQTSSLTCQLLILHRVPLDGWVQQIFKRMHTLGARIVFDTDDLIFDEAVLPALADPVLRRWARVQLYQAELRGYRQTLLASDAVLVSTNFLADRARALGKLAYVHRNAFSNEMLAGAQKAVRSPHKKIVLGYASGTATHDKDFASIAPVLQNLLDVFPQIELHLLGYLNLDHTWQKYEERFKRLPFVAWRVLPNYLINFDINLAPLELTNPFCQAKSEIKYVEAALVGVPTVASATSSFAEAMRQDETGFLVSTLDDWAHALRRLIEDESLRRTIGAQAQADVWQRYPPQVRAEELKKILPLLAPALEIPAKNFALKSNHQTTSPRPFWWRAYYALRYRGLKIFFWQIIAFWQTRFS